jgi:hypothetical protein
MFVVTDRNIKSKHVFRTIDTVSIPRLGLSHLADGSRKLNNPLVVNKRAIAYKGVLFVESNRKESWKKTGVIKQLYLIFILFKSKNTLAVSVFPTEIRSNVYNLLYRETNCM